MKLLGRLDVWTKFEDGLLGITPDPNFRNNGWLYMFYSPNIERPVQRVSRFLLSGDSLVLASERVLLEIPVQRDECCHSAGSLAFGPEGNLFIALGDNSSPFNTKGQNFDSNGFSPRDERPGREPYDAQRSSGNTNDLRGKILRITPTRTGYTLPEGNLFPNGRGGRPEIYAMGLRNPYRIGIDQQRGWLFWGDIGPDAGENDSLRGPRGYDEFNVATKAGNFGWPYFVGNNYAYHRYNYATGEAGAAYNPQRPLNMSVNNTGATVLPPAQPALVWYPYAESDDFPILGKGGRSAMAGPSYYSDRYPSAKFKLPDYYNGKTFFYEWMRNWILAATVNDAGELVELERFMPELELVRPTDMELGPDGALYVLEYGTEWFSPNADARLSRIDYAAGNRPPKARIAASKTVGAAPLEVDFSAEQSADPDSADQLHYRWLIDGEEVAQSANLKYTFTTADEYNVQLLVTDGNGGSSKARQPISVGNEPPKVSFTLAGNRSFYFADNPLNYQVQVTDKEDGAVTKNIAISLDYQSLGTDETLIAQGHQQRTAALNGKTLVGSSDCSTCHAIKQQVNGPAYLEVAQRYTTGGSAAAGVVQQLAKKLLQAAAVTGANALCQLTRSSL